MTSTEVGLRQRSVGVSPSQSVTSSNSESTTAHPPEKKIHSKAVHPPEKNFLQKLFTHKEEVQFYHVHKILGVTALLSFLYRFCHIGKADGNFGPTFGTVFFVLHHFLLNASSFIFKLPKQRIQDGGYRIWPEYRMHALIFASRNLAFIALRAYEQSRHRYIGLMSRHNLWPVDLVIVLMTCALADLASYSQGKYRSSTIRDATFSDPYEQWFASEMQLYLTAFCLTGYRRYTLHLVALWVIQCNSFLMTLRRKNVASHYVLVGCYSILLLLAMVFVTMDDWYTHRIGSALTFGGVAIVLRMGLGVNKYVMWTGLWAVWWYIRTSHVVSPYNTMPWMCGLFLTRAVAVYLGWKKRSKAPEEQKSKLVGNVVVGIHVALVAYLFLMNVVIRPRMR